MLEEREVEVVEVGALFGHRIWAASEALVRGRPIGVEW